MNRKINVKAKRYKIVMKQMIEFRLLIIPSKKPETIIYMANATMSNTTICFTPLIFNLAGT
ncbi:MAG: hypothetical protein Q6363_002150 [Candidatus Njordarchaeota archaeon]